MAEQKKIVVFDCCRFKFMWELMKHWEDLGCEVKKALYWDPKLVEWADIVFFDWIDNSLVRASNSDDEFYKSGLYLPQPQNKKIIARCHDIDAWCGHYKNVKWNWVNDLIFITEHIKDLVLKSIDIPSNVKVHLIKHGINLEKFTFRKESIRNNKIAWVGRITHHKCLELALQVLAENPEYELHAVGSSLDSWELAYVNDFVRRNGLKFFHYPVVLDMNEFLEDKSFILLTSFKEVFSFAVGEGMAKGLKPLIHRFFGANNVWSEEFLWDKISDVKPMLEGSYEHLRYRQYIEDNYPLQKMLDSYDKVMFSE